MNPIFKNAIDSLEFGIRLYVGGEKRVRKFAILIVYQAIELLLKERLYREDRRLVFRTSAEKMTVGLPEALSRFDDIGVKLSEGDMKNLDAMRKRRNDIQHYCYDPERDDVSRIGQALKLRTHFSWIISTRAWTSTSTKKRSYKYAR